MTSPSSIPSLYNFPLNWLCLRLPESSTPGTTLAYWQVVATHAVVGGKTCVFGAMQFPQVA